MLKFRLLIFLICSLLPTTLALDSAIATEPNDKSSISTLIALDPDNRSSIPSAIALEPNDKSLIPSQIALEPPGEPPLPADIPLQTVTTSDGEQHQVPDIAETRLGQLKFEEQGVFIDQTLTLPPTAWNPGQTAADALTIGSAQTTFQRQITIDQISRIGGFDPLQFPLDGIPPVAGASLGELAKAVPNLGKTRIRDSFLTKVGNRRPRGLLGRIQGTVFGNRDAQAIARFITERPELSQVPINSLIDRDWGGVVKGAVRVGLVRLLRDRGVNYGSVAVGRLNLKNPAGAVFAGASLFSNLRPQDTIQRFIRRDPDATINDLIRDNPNFRKVPITALGDISRLRVGDIKGLPTTDLGQIPSAKAHPLSSIPGASNVRIGQLIQGLKWTTPVLGKLGPAYGSNDGVEAVANRSVSGGTPSNRFRAQNCGGEDCAHFEFDTMPGSPIQAGRTWVGGQQTTRGGVGPLAAVNGGKEPAGIKINNDLPFKFVIDNIDGKAGAKPGTATQSLYFQVCAKPPFAPKTCTPHILRFPLQTVKENDVVIAAVTPEKEAEKIQPFFAPKTLEPNALQLPEEPTPPKPQQKPQQKSVFPLTHPYGKLRARVPTFRNVYWACRDGRRCPRRHPGLDLFGGYGKNIFAPADGKVYQSDYSFRCNHYVGIKHANGVRTRHVHLSSRAVKLGQIVKRGQLIGKEGAPIKDKRCGVGSHLHYEVYNPGLVNPICVPHDPPLPAKAQDGTSLQRHIKC